MSTHTNPKLYHELAGWWPLVSAPEDYAEEAAFYTETLGAACDHEPRSLLELGSGGGNNASHMKGQFDAVTLVDRSPRMLEVSRDLNPGCEHMEGDMRSVRLDRTFDCVCLHDALAYLTTASDVSRTADTASTHCAPGGVALFAPDYLTETFRPSTRHGGHDGEGRGLRYLEWLWDPVPDDGTALADFVFVLREGDGLPRTVFDRHVVGLFPKAEWTGRIGDAGFEVSYVPFRHSELPDWEGPVFVARKATG